MGTAEQAYFHEEEEGRMKKDALSTLEYIRDEAIAKHMSYFVSEDDIKWVNEAIDALKKTGKKGCHGCRYFREFDYCFRCKVCSRSYMDRWEGEQ